MVPPPSAADISIISGMACICLECTSGTQSRNQDGKATGGDSEAAARVRSRELCLRNVNPVAAELCYRYGYQDESS